MGAGLWRQPLWARGALLGMLFAGVMSVLGLIVGFDVEVVLRASVVAGLFFGAGAAAVFAVWERRWFAGEQPPLTGDERVEAVLAVRRQVRPDDPRVRDSALRMAHQRLARPAAGWMAGVFGFSAATGVIQAVTRGPGWWFEVGWWLLCALLLMVSDGRGRGRARAFLAVADGERTSS